MDLRVSIFSLAMIFPASAVAGVPPRVTAQDPQACGVPTASADYVEGVDVKGHAVAPADVPAEGDIAVGTEIFAHVQTKNRTMGRIGVAVDLSRLKPKPCKPAAKRRPRGGP